MKGLIIAGTKSGSGKTTLTLGLLAALKRRGLNVTPFKVGPDFIDPGHHFAITGTPSTNLDGWMLSKAYNRDRFVRRTQNADIAVVEGVMGLFDGYDGKSEAGSTAQMAKWLDLPVLLIVDAASMARSAAALVQGFERFDAQVDFAGVVFNQIGSKRHLDYLMQALSDTVGMPCLGGMVRDEHIRIPERHLGLVTREDHYWSGENISNLADLIEKSLRVDDLLERLPPVEPHPTEMALAPLKASHPLKIGVARDRAFCFYYQDNLDLLTAAGAGLIEFSPISNTNLPANIDGLYFGGGYPELAAKALADNSSMREQVLSASKKGMPIYGECGGFMYLCHSLSDADENTYPMAGCFPFQTCMSTRLRSLGYREVTLSQSTVIGKAGLRLRGHEFHYSSIIKSKPADHDSPAAVYRVTSRDGVENPPAGYQINRTLGSYIHLHFGSQPDAASEFVNSCLAYHKERTSR